jgi:hypothetical protein
MARRVSPFADEDAVNQTRPEDRALSLARAHGSSRPDLSLLLPGGGSYPDERTGLRIFPSEETTGEAAPEVGTAPAGAVTQPPDERVPGPGVPPPSVPLEAPPSPFEPLTAPSAPQGLAPQGPASETGDEFLYDFDAEPLKATGHILGTMATSIHNAIFDEDVPLPGDVIRQRRREILQENEQRLRIREAEYRVANLLSTTLPTLVERLLNTPGPQRQQVFEDMVAQYEGVLPGIRNSLSNAYNGGGDQLVSMMNGLKNFATPEIQSMLMTMLNTGNISGFINLHNSLTTNTVERFMNQQEEVIYDNLTGAIMDLAPENLALLDTPENMASARYYRIDRAAAGAMALERMKHANQLRVERMGNEEWVLVRDEGTGVITPSFLSPKEIQDIVADPNRTITGVGLAQLNQSQLQRVVETDILPEIHGVPVFSLLDDATGIASAAKNIVNRVFGQVTGELSFPAVAEARTRVTMLARHFQRAAIVADRVTQGELEAIRGETDILPTWLDSPANLRAKFVNLAEGLKRRRTAAQSRLYNPNDLGGLDETDPFVKENKALIDSINFFLAELGAPDMETWNIMSNAEKAQNEQRGRRVPALEGAINIRKITRTDGPPEDENAGSGGR